MAQHDVATLARDLDDLIAGVVDRIAVVSRAARHPVGPALAVESVAACVAVQDVVAGQPQAVSGPPCRSSSSRSTNIGGIG
ncbi:MAG: hypothetical protein IPG28_18725 [Betaproteobacteria bacterium]|nr:hypothetical protein [Betaproteobacteria bacterium]